MNTATQKTQSFEAEVLQFWADQARLERTASDALADYLASVRHAPLAPTQGHSGHLTH